MSGCFKAELFVRIRVVQVPDVSRHELLNGVIEKEDVPDRPSELFAKLGQPLRDDLSSRLLFCDLKNYGVLGNRPILASAIEIANNQSVFLPQRIPVSRLLTILRVDRFENIVNVVLDRANRNEQALANLLVGESIMDEPKTSNCRSVKTALWLNCSEDCLRSCRLSWDMRSTSTDVNSGSIEAPC